MKLDDIRILKKHLSDLLKIGNMKVYCSLYNLIIENDKLNNKVNLLNYELDKIYHEFSN